MSSESSAGPRGWSPSFPCPISLERHLSVMERYATPLSDISTRLPDKSPDHRASSSPGEKDGPNSLPNLAMAYSQSIQAHTYQQMVKVVQKKHSLETIPVAVTVAERSISSTPSPTSEVKQEPFDDSPWLVGPGVPELLQLPEDFVTSLPTPPPEPIFFHRPYFYKRTSRERPGVYGYRLPWSMMRKGITARPEDVLLRPNATEPGEARARAKQNGKRVYSRRDDILTDESERRHKRHRSKLQEEVHPEGESSNHQDNEIESPALWPVLEDPFDFMSQELQVSESAVFEDAMQRIVCDGAVWTKLTCGSLSDTQDVVPISTPWDERGFHEPKLHAGVGIASAANKENVTISVASLLN